MKISILYNFLLSFCIVSTGHSSLSSLYSSLDPTSVTQHFAFYELYPKSIEGKKALNHAWTLLQGDSVECNPELTFPQISLQPMISLIHRSSKEEVPILTEDLLEVIENLAKNLGNRQLQGFQCPSREDFLQLPGEQIDLARGLLLFETDTIDEKKIRSYEAMLDLMALQILARLDSHATPKQKIRAINDYLFSELRFRFPPKSLYAKEIDSYSFLPFVLDNRQGVCLGVSILYLSLSQRLHLVLESITPPGHIYVRHVGENGEIVNIETTARGIDLPCEVFLGVETKALQKRTLKEVLGLAFMNQAAVSWQANHPEIAVTLYEKASLFLPNDYLLNLFLGLNYLFIGKKAEGSSLLQKIRGIIPSHAISPDTLSEDYLDGLTSAEYIKAIFVESETTRNEILKKQQELEEFAAKYPKCRQGIFHLAITYLQLGREKEALPLLEKCASLDPQNPTVHHYLAQLYLQRHNYPQSWVHLLQAEKIVQAKHHYPRALKALRQSLKRLYPEPEEAENKNSLALFSLLR